MPRNQQRKSTIGSFEEADMKRAVQRVIDGESIRSVAKSMNLNYVTLSRYVKKFKNHDNALLSKETVTPMKFAPNYSVNLVFPQELEDQLCEYVITASKLHHGLTRSMVQKLAFELAVINQLHTPESWKKNNEAGEDWLYGFRKRHPNIAIRKPEPTSLGRSTAFNKFNVSEFFNNLEKAYKRIPEDKLNPSCIYNLDETALTTVHNPPKVLSQRGQKQIGQVTSGERGVLVTMCGFINASGNSIPPYLVFPRVNFKLCMLNGAPPGTAGNATKSGWMNGDIFVSVLKHFQRHTRCSKENPVILIMDNHESHITISSLNFTSDNGITVVTLPPHTSNKLQPLDKTVFKSLKNFFNLAANDWMLCNPGRAISIYEISSLLGTAYFKSFTPQNITKGFSATGIWPFNREIFSEEDYLCSYVSDRPCPSENYFHGQINETEEQTNETEYQTDKIQEFGEVGLAPSRSESPIAGCSATVHTPCTSSKPARKYISPYDIKPYPKAGPRKERKVAKQKKKSFVLTTPVKNALVKQLEGKKKKAKKGLFSNQTPPSTDSEDGDDPDYCPAVADHRSTKNEISPYNMCETSSICINDYVLIKEGELKQKEMYCIGEIVKLNEVECEVLYIKRLRPSFKFVRSAEIYIFERTQIVLKLPPPIPSGATERKAEMLIFETDLSKFNIK